MDLGSRILGFVIFVYNGMIDNYSMDDFMHTLIYNSWKKFKEQTIDMIKVLVTLVKKQKWPTLCKTVDYDCAYVCAPHLVQLK